MAAEARATQGAWGKCLANAQDSDVSGTGVGQQGSSVAKATLAGPQAPLRQSVTTGSRMRGLPHH